MASSSIFCGSIFSGFMGKAFLSAYAAILAQMGERKHGAPTHQRV